MAPRDVAAPRVVGVAERVIEVRGLVKRYPDITAVDGIDFDVNRGEVFSLLGPNGAGKTTTVEILEGLRDPTAGEARVLGQDVRSGYRRIRERVGVVPGARLEPEPLVGAVKRRGRTVRQTRHELDEAEHRADDGAITNHGKLAAHGRRPALSSQFGGGTPIVLAGTGRGGSEARTV